MFSELDKYQQTGHLFFKASDHLSTVCNAPADKGGIYIIYKLSNGMLELVYIGSSCRKGNEGEMIHWKGVLKGRFLTGKQFSGLRSATWPLKMKADNIDALDVYWYVTYDNHCKDFPQEVEMLLLRKFYNIYGRLPECNSEF